MQIRDIMIYENNNTFVNIADKYLTEPVTDEKCVKTVFGTAKLNNKGYYQISTRKEGNAKKFLHRLIYESHFGIKIPPNFSIHHFDGNPFNNSIFNLFMLPTDKHLYLHKHGGSFSEEHRLNKSKAVNNTGYFKVVKAKCSSCNQGFIYRYLYDVDGKRKTISSTNILKLKEKVLAKGLKWKKLEGN